MRNSAAKRIIAVLLCLVVFAGSELSGLTNIVGDLFAEETTTGADEGDRDNAIETIDIEDTSDDVVEEVEVTEEAAPEAEPEETVEPSEPSESEAEPEAPAEDAVVEEAPSDTPEAEEDGETSVDETENQGEETPADTEQKDDAADASDVENNDNVPDSSDVENNEDVSDTDDAETKDDTADVNDINKENTETPDNTEVTEGEETPDATNTPEGEEVPAEEDIKDEQEVLPEETEEPTNPEEDITYSEFADKYSDDKVEIQVNAEEGVLPEGVMLSVTPIVKQDVEELEAKEDITQEELDQVKEINEKYDTTAEKLEETVADDDTKNIAGFLAYDISFFITETDEETSEETQVEIEPNGNVNVTMDFADGYLPEELAENEAVSVSSVDVVHMKEEDGEVQPEVLTDAAVDTTENAEVKTAEFTVDSFSTFVITWNGGGVVVQLNLVNMDGGEIGGAQTIVPGDALISLNFEDMDNDATLKEIYTIDYGNKTYTFVEARVFGENKQTPLPAVIAEIRKGDGVVEWRRKGSDNWENNGSSVVTFEVFYSDASIKEVPSLDSASEGVRLFMQDYDFDDNLMNNILGSVGTDATQDLVQPVLTDGFPVVSKDSVSLKPWFGNGKEVNGLFRADKFEQEGIFYYSCFENYAYLGNSDQFTLYDQIGTPTDTADGMYSRRGNFFPYNRIIEGKLSSATEQFDENGNFLELPEGEMGRKMYEIQPEEGKSKLNFHFSMRLETDFIQGVGGQYQNEPMIYKFNGDDDLWVFIDDVLVLDIGGNHPARSGSINFATGEVIVNQSNTTKTTTIKNCFDKALGYCKENGIEKTIPNKWVEYEQGHFRFEDNSGHTLKMFYMERNDSENAGGSSLKISFNLPTIEADKIRVTKELTGTAQAQYANVDFDFRVWVKNAASGELEPLKTQAEDDDKNPITVDQETGIFQLKPGQSAWFSDLPVDTEYYVEEIGYGKNDSDYIVEETTYQEYDTTNQTGASVKGTKTDPKLVKERKRVVFTNRCSENIKNDLQITKVMNGDSSEQGPFTIKVWLEDRTGVLVPYVGDYYIDETQASTSDGTISLAVNKTASICGLVAGTGFYVEELNLDLSKYEEPEISLQPDTYESDNCQSNSGETVKVAQGAITKGEDAKVTVKNTLKGAIVTDGSLQITKKMQEGSTAVEAESSFEFEIKMKKDSEEFVAYTGEYTLNGEKQTASEGRITIPVDGTAMIASIPGGTKFQVKEVLGEDSPYMQPDIKLQTGEGEVETVTPGEMAEGEILAGKDTKITVTNILKPIPSYSYDWQIVKKGSSEEGAGLEGAIFTLKRAANQDSPEVIFYGRSQKDTGIIEWFADAEMKDNPVEHSSIEPGTYTLTETKAPSGFVLSNIDWTIELGYDEVKVSDSSGVLAPTNNEAKTEDEKTIYEYTFLNEAVYELPSTGGAGIFWYMVSGTLLMMAGILILYKRKYAGRC